MSKKKMTKEMMKKVGLFFPSKHDVVKSDNFSYAQYIEDVNAFRKGLLQGYLEDYQDVPIYKDGYLDNSFSYKSERFDALVARLGDLDIDDYEREIKTLHNEFVERILAGEKLDVVDREVSLKMQELATRNIDGTHNEFMERILDGTYTETKGLGNR